MRWPVKPKPTVGSTREVRRFLFLPERTFVPKGILPQPPEEWVWWEWVVDEYVMEVHEHHPHWPDGGSELVYAWRHIATKPERVR